MCGRYAIPDQAAVERLCATDFKRGFSWMRPLFNVAPATQVPILVKDAGNGLATRSARWGLIPSWWQKEAFPPPAINARSEEVADKPLWRDSFKSVRCLMPALGWYEWNANQLVPGKAGRQGGQPYFLSCSGDEAIAFAALWSIWQRPGAAPVVSCSLLTKPAAPGIAFIHPRMPVVLKPGQFAAWLDPAATREQLLALVAGARDDFASRPVSPRVNNVRNDGPELIEKVAVAATGSLDFGGSP